MPNRMHRTVLLQETIDGLDLKNNSLVLDATFGGGGHSKEILLRYPNAKVIAMDQDNTVWERAKEKFEGLENRISFLNANFRDMGELNFKDIDGIIFDLGLSSDQLENSGRGFSFLKNEPLVMQMKNREEGSPSDDDVTAWDVVNTWDEKNLADIIYGYGEERFSRKIAKAIVAAREKAEINTTFELVRIIESAVGKQYKKNRIHCATKTFQAIRIAVNDELNSLEQGLRGGFKILKTEGRMAVISFHSLEDRIVKRFFRTKVREGQGELINKKPIIASEDEIKNNPRARSAKLRIFEK